MSDGMLKAKNKILAWKEYGNEEMLLDLSGLGLSHLPAEIAMIPQLQGLMLDNNLFTCVPQEIEALKELSLLSLKNNKITHLAHSLTKKYMLLEVIPPYGLHIAGNPLPQEVLAFASLHNPQRTSEIFQWIENNSL